MKRKRGDSARDDEALFFDLVRSARDRKDLKVLLDEICTPVELSNLMERVAIAKAIYDGMSYRQIQGEFGASSYLVARTKREILGSKTGFTKKYLTKLKGF